MRIVYDASAQTDGVSLNNCLYTGPKFDQRIMDILLRFRTYRIAVTADIEKAFLMISVAPTDRDALRFLWVKNPKQEPLELITLRFTRVVFGVCSSPFLLNATLRYHIEQFSVSHPQVSKELARSFYVDDLISGSQTEEEALQLYLQSKDILKQGGFNLRKFLTNSECLQLRIKELENTSDHIGNEVNQDTYAKCTLATAQRPHVDEQKILGICWNFKSDHLVYEFQNIDNCFKEPKLTKRRAVGIVGRFYDPLGFVAPVIIRFKVYFQKLCKEGIGWDDEITGELSQEWESLLNDLHYTPRISIPRCYLEGMLHVDYQQLCGFCDASQKAYAAVVYLLLRSGTRGTVKFVAAKTRVAPLQEQTIPRLELLSALLLSRLMQTTMNALNDVQSLKKPVCFTDSRVVFYWIRGIDKEWKPFVQNRVMEIRKAIPISSWKHCPGSSNPADIPSRGATFSDPVIRSRWFNGPEWLATTQVYNDELEDPMPEECVVEIKTKEKAVHSLAVMEGSTGIRQLMDPESYSSFKKLINVTSCLFKFLRKEKSSSLLDKARAEVMWLVESQRSLTSDCKFELWKTQFGLSLDENKLWRCTGRLTNAKVPYTTRHPIILHRNDHITMLIVKEAHERVQHNGTKETLTEVRSKYWIVKGRQLVRKLIYRCVVCRRYEGLAFKSPPPPPLPKFRVVEEPAFTHTGIDFAGPLYVKSGGSNNSDKVWICLYSCCIVRAIHLDIVPDMSTPTFIRSLKRFIARRGLPKRIVSDNGKTFKAAAKIIKIIIEDPEVQSYCNGIGIEWLFNVEKAPWWGGFFERMVKMTKRCLKKTIGRAKFTYDELLTSVTEVEAIINSRPLSYISAEDVDEPLTPSHLLIGRRLLNLPDYIWYQENREEDEDISINHGCLTRRMRYLNNTLDHFWKRWKTEYLTELRESHRQTKKVPKQVITIGDIVLVQADAPQRGILEN